MVPWHGGLYAGLVHGDFAGLLIGYWPIYLLTLIFLILGWRASAAYALKTAQWDAKECVIDEVAATLLICCFMPLFLPPGS